MPDQSAHPSEEKLSAYNRGLLSPDEAITIETHISDCEACCETIVSLSSDDTFVGLLKEARQLSIDQTLDHDSEPAQSPSSHRDIPPELAEHPRYGIVRLIGIGGMGDVYEAIHRKMERKVALKVINRELFQKAEAVNRFHREVKTAAQLSHPNIVTSHDADQAGDHHFMVMEYVDGVDLSHVVKDRGALPVAEACDYIRQAAIGLQHAHERNMVHRDIKPHNLMVTADGTIKILDFGLASLTPEAISASDAVEARSDLTAAGTIMGTPDFISPEQAEDARQVDIRSDIYSLGATLYYLLSGRVPFDDGSVMHKLNSHAQVEPAPLDSVRDDVPKELVAIASKMMAKDPDERYLTPKEVADALESFLRTWRPSEVGLQGHDPSGGGNYSDSGGQKHGAGDSNPSRLPIVAKWLLYTSLLPIAILLLDEFVPLGVFSGETDWFWHCVLTSVVLSTIGGIVAGVHQAMTSKRDDRRVNRSTTDRNLLMIVVLAVSALGYLRYTSDGVVHNEVTPQDERDSTSDDRSPADGNKLPTASTSPSQPELKVTGKTVNKGTAGLPSLYDWNFKGRDVGDLKVRLLLAQNGKSEVIQDFDFEEIPAQFATKVRLEVRDDATGVDHKRRVNAILFVESPVPSRNATVNEDKGLSIDVEAPFSNKTERADLTSIAPGQAELLLALSYWKGDMTHDLSMESMTEATKGGNATFLFVTLDWSPSIPDESGGKELDK